MEIGTDGRSAPTDACSVELPVVTGEQTLRLAQSGFVTFDGLWGQPTADAVAAEAGALLRTVDTAVRDVGAPAQATASEAPVLRQLQFSLLPLVRAVTGQLLVPSYGWYNLYPTSDGIWLHVDVERSDLAVLATALGTVGPLHLHPQLSGRTQTELDTLRRSDSWNDHGGCQVGYPPGGIVALRGRHLPHHRPKSQLQTPAAVMALHYTSFL